MTAIIKVTWYDDYRDTNPVLVEDYMGMSECNSFEEAAAYAEREYGELIEKLEIELLDSTLYLTADNVKALHDGKF